MLSVGDQVSYWERNLSSMIMTNDLGRISWKLTFDNKILDHFSYKFYLSKPRLSGTLVHVKILLRQFLNKASDILGSF